MDIESVGSNDKACFGCGRHENKVKWWGNDVKIMLKRTH
jgi:hypothetical protein